MKTVLVAEESRDLRRLLVETLPCLFPDWRTLGAANLQEADKIHRSQILSLAIIDMGFNGNPESGLSLLTRWKRDGVRFPIVVTTSAHSLLRTLWSAEPDEVLLKPWDIFEIRVRLERAMNRWTKPHPSARESARADGVQVTEAFLFAGAVISPDFTCHLPDGHVEKLGAKEYGILTCLAKARGTVVLREHLLWTVWGADADTASNSVNVYLSRLRCMFANHGGTFDKEVATEPKIGWRVSPSVK